MKTRIRNARIAFPNLFEAKTVQGEGKPAFSASFLLDPKDPQVAALNDLIDKVGAEKWGTKAAGIVKTLRATDKVCLHDGNNKSNYQGFEDMLYVSARGYTKPLVLDEAKNELTAQSGKPYAGCYVDAVLEIYAQDNNYGKRINATLKGVQFRRDGDAFAGGAPASDADFDDLSVEQETADDLT